MSNKNTKILITGATGLLGSHLLRELLAQGYTNLRALCRSTSDKTQVADIQANIEWVEGDVLDIFSLEEAMEGVEKVFHCAAMISYQARDAKRMLKVNVEGTANVVNAALEKGVKHLIYVSSIAALGENKKEEDLIHEKTTWERSKDNSDYSLSKYLAEQEVWRGAAEGLNIAVVNPSIILGFGNWKESSTTLFLQVWKGLKFYPTGTTGYVDVKDVVRFMILLLENEVKDQRFILNGANLGFQDFFNQVADALHKPRPTIRLRAWIAAIAWRFAAVYSKITGKSAFITRSTVNTVFKVRLYDNSKSLSFFKKNFQYTAIETTIKEIGAKFLIAK